MKRVGVECSRAFSILRFSDRAFCEYGIAQLKLINNIDHYERTSDNEYRYSINSADPGR